MHFIHTFIHAYRTPYTYRWIPGNEDSVSLSARGAGLYVLQVTDITGESATAWINIAAPERPDWSMSGNAETEPESQFIGTTDSTDVVFRTNNIEALRLAANKNMGVGVNEPTAKLDVSGTLRVRENLLVDSLAFNVNGLDNSTHRILVVDKDGVVSALPNGLRSDHVPCNCIPCEFTYLRLGEILPEKNKPLVRYNVIDHHLDEIYSQKVYRVTQKTEQAGVFPNPCNDFFNLKITSEIAKQV